MRGGYQVVGRPEAAGETGPYANDPGREACPMPVTVTDLFCGAGGSSLGAEAVANVEVVMAANQGFR